MYLLLFIAASLSFGQLRRTTEYEQIINKNDKIAYQTSRFLYYSHFV